ncbi:alpha/beta hydrolase [Kitasatospora sp. NPDC051705]|uniref:alpha/beta hydrolase n=1 Tax=Kitasatospora sp. NPDC051705 TaxID=3364057 RepID=UPI00378DA1E0
MVESWRSGPAEVRPVTLEADGLPVSGLLAEPPGGRPRAVVVALHGGGMSAGYFDCRAVAGQSLLALGAGLGCTVLALDRPGYGASAAHLPDGQGLAEQSATLHRVLAEFARRHPVGAGYFVVAHSYGGKLALAAAADPAGRDLLGLDISGLGHRHAVDPELLPGPDRSGEWRRHWGSTRHYPTEAFTLARALVSPMPHRESAEVPRWPGLLPGLAARVRTPVRFTFAEQEQWWRHDEEAVTELAGLFTGTTVWVDRQPGAGHNVSLGWAARSYHLRALAFLDQCLLAGAG